jgi:hypothetical protein
MGLRLRPERLRVHLPATLAAAGGSHHLSATCTHLEADAAQLDTDAVPAPGERLELVIALPRQRTLKLFGTVTWSITTSAPALLCGQVDRSLGGRFTIEFAPTSPDLFALADLLRQMQQSRQRRRTRVSRIARRFGVPSAPIA